MWTHSPVTIQECLMSYVNSSANRSPDPNRKYGRNHWGGCLCEACREAFEMHQESGYCPCVDCERTREAASAQLRAQQEETTQKYTEREYKVATVNLCDKCGTMSKSSATGTVVIVPVNDKADVYGDAVRTITGETIRKEICPGCVGELMAWLDADPLNERPRAYSDAWTKPTDPTVPTDSATLFQLALEASKREAGISSDE